MYGRFTLTVALSLAEYLWTSYYVDSLELGFVYIQTRSRAGGAASVRGFGCRSEYLHNARRRGRRFYFGQNDVDDARDLVQTSRR